MINKQRLGMIGSAGVPGKYGGFETITHQLVLRLRETYDITVFCSKRAYSRTERTSMWKGVHLSYLPFRSTGKQSALYDVLSLLMAVVKCDILFVLGVAGAIVFPFIKIFTSRKIIVNVDGLEWQRSNWLIHRMYLRFAEKLAVRWADRLIADNQSISDYLTETYSCESTLIEYGGDHVNRLQPGLEDLHQFPFFKKRYAIKVCRIEPENNIELILKTFARYPKYPLVIIGNWSERAYGRALRQQYQGYSHLYLLDSVYDAELLNKLRSHAYLYIHGHMTGGTNPSLVEAMSLGLPVFAFDISYNRETTEKSALYFNNEEALIRLLEAAGMQKIEKLGLQMLEIATRRYNWEKVSDKYKQLLEAVTAVPAPASHHPDLSGFRDVELQFSREIKR